MSRIIQKSRVPARRALSSLMALLMLLSAVVVALPLLAVLVPALSIKADAAPYAASYAGAQEALGNGDYFRAAQLAAGSFAFSDVDSSVPAAIGSDHTNNALWRGNVRLQDIPGADIFYNSTENVNEYLTRKGLDGLVTGISYWHYADGTSGHGGVDGAPAAGQIIEDVATSRRTLYWTSNAWRIESGTGAWSPPDADMRRGGVVPGTGATPAASTEPSTLPDIIQTKTRDISTALKEYPTIADIPASIYLEGNLVIGHERFSRRTLPNGLPGGGNYASGDNGSNYRETSIHTRQSWSNGYAADIRIYTDYLNKLQFVVDTTTNEDLSGVKTALNNVLPSITGVTVKDLVNVYTLGELESIRDAGSNPAGTATNDGATVATPRSWAEIRIPVVAAIQTANAHITEAQAQQIFDKYISNAPSAVAGQTQYALWYNKVVDAIAISKAFGAIKTFYSTETGALTNPNVGLDPKNVGFIVKTVPSIFANNGVKFTFAEATTLSIQLIADQADGGGHLYDTLDRVGTSKVTADDIDALATIGGNQLAALATLSSAGMGSQASGSRIQYVKDQWAEWGSGAINTNIVSATSGAAWAWVENCKLVAAAWFWAENKPIIDDFVATYKDITADFHIGARQIDDKNSDWNDAFPEGVAAVFNNGANLTPEQEALITGAYRVKNAEIPYSTYEILLYNTQGAFYKRVVEAVAAAQGITNVELYPAFTDLDTITKALKAESAYRTTIDETTNIVDEGGNPVVDENGVQQTFTQRVAGYEPQWYRERMFWADNWYPTTTLRAMNDENLAALLAQLEARRVDYFTMSDKAKGDLAALGHADWWDEIYCVTNPIDANPSHDRQTYVPETEWGKAVIPQRIDDVYYELARRFAEPVNAAMAEYAKYDASGQVKIDGNIATVDMEQIGPLRTLISQIPANVLDALLNHAQGLTYINNASVYPTTDLNEPAKIYSLTGTYNTLYGTRSSADQAYAAQWADVSGRTIIGDWLFLKFLVSDVIKEFEENPEKYWAHTRSWQWSNDGGVTSNGTTELTGLYVTRYGDTITVDGDPVDVARKPGEDFNVEGHRVNSFLNSLDGLIGKDGNIKDILAALGVDLSSVGVDVETATTVNVNTILQSLVTNSLYTDELVNTLLTYLYGMVLPMFENVFANFKDAINPSSLPQFGTDTHLDIYSLHELLANGTGPEKTSNDRNVYDIAGSTKPIGSSNTDKTDGNAFNIESRSNVNTLTDLRLYPDLLGGILDNTFSASDPYYTGGKKSPKEQLTSPVATGLNGYTIGGGTAIDIEKPRVVSWNGSNTGYGYNIDTWKNASIFQQTLNPDGTPVWEVLGESGLDDDPSTPYIDESKIYDTTKPVGTLTLDWGINAQTDPTARATRFKAALGNALAGVFPLVQALLLGIEYQGFVPKVGKLEGGSKKNITGGDSAYNGEAYMWYATYTQGAAAVPMVVPSISLKLSASGNDGFAKVITPILELLAGLDGSTGAKSVYNKIPTVDQLRSFKDTTKPGFPARLDQADQAGYWGTQSMGYNASHFAGYDMRYNNWGYTYGTQTREASKGFVNALFAPIDQFLLNLGEKPIRELLRLLPSLSYALSLDRIAPLLAGLETIITPDVNGLVQLQVPSGINSLVGDLPNGALQGGSYMTDNIYVNFGRRQDGAFRHSFSAGTGDDIWGIRHDGGYWNTPGDVNIDEYFYGSKPGYALYMNKRLYLLWGAVDEWASGGRNPMTMDDIIPPMDTMPVKIFGDVSQGAILDPSMLSGYLGAGSVEGLLNAVSPSVTGVLPASLRGMLGMILGTYGDLGTSASGGIPTKRPAGVQPRHYVDAEVVSLLYAILRVALNGETLADVGLNLDDLGLPLDLSDPDMAIAAIMELHKPYGNPVTVNGAPTLTAGEKIRGYDIRPVDYGNATVNAPTILDCPIPVDHQGKTLLNKVIAAATGGVFYDLDGMVKELLGESVYSADTFALIANLLNGAIGPDGSLSGILGTVSGIVPELGAILNPFATAFTPAQYEVIAPLYLTWSSAHVDGESFAKDAKLPFNYSFKPNMVAGVQVKVDDPDTLWDDTLVCTNQAVAGTQKLSGNADNPATLLVDESLVVKKAHNAANTGWRFDYIDPATTDEAEQLRLQQYPNYFYADIVGVTLGDITTTVQDAEGNETEVTTYGPIFTETGFYNALYKLVGPLVPLLRTFLLDEDFSLLASGAGATKNAVLTIPGYNGYETGFVPLMEGLGFTNEGLNETGVIASYSALKALTNSKADQETFVKLLFKPIVTALGQLSTDPISFLLGKLPQIVYFLLAGTALEDSVRNLLKSPLVLLDTIRPLVAIDLKPYFEYLSVEGLFNQFGAVLQDTLALPGVPLDLYGLIYDDANFSFLKSLIIGTPTLYTSVAGTATPTANTYSATGANDQRAADRKGKINGGTEIGDTQYPLITCPPDQYFNNIILKLIAFVNDQTDVGTGANSLLDSLITDPAIRDLALSVLANLGTEEGAEALFDVLWQLLYGAHNVANDAQVYKGYADYKAPAYPGIGTAFQYKDGWTQEKAEKFVSGVGIDASHENELDLILDAILKLVGLPDTQTLISGFLTNGELVGTYPLGEAPVFSSAFFNKITGLISSITDDESIASILTVAAQYLSSDSLNLTQFFTPYDEDGTGWKHKSDLEAKIAAIDTAAAADKAEAFKLALVEFLKPLQGVLDLLLVGGDLNLVGLYADEDDSDRKAGCEYLLKIAGYKGYEFGLAPILAALGVKVPNYADVKKDPIGEIIQAIIDSVLTDLAKDPIKYVLDNLPNLLAFIHAHYTVGTGETAYTETALKAAVKQLITPVYALATALDPLLAGVVIPGFNDGQPINVQKLVDDILVTLDVDKLVNDFLLGGVDLGGTALTLPTTDEIYQALIIGTVGAQTTKAAIDAPHSTFLDVPTISTEPLEKHAPAQRVNADREAVFTNLVQFALTYATSGRNYDAIASLLGGTLPPIVETVLKNVQAKPQSLLAILYAVRFGADIENPDDVYSDLSGINAGPFVYEAPWTAEKAEQFIQGYKVSTNTLRGNKELDLIANWVVRTLGVTDFDGQPVESVKGLVDSALGTYAYNEQLFLQITSALQSIADNEGLAKILEIVDEVLDVDLADFLDTTDIDLSNLAADKTPAVRKAAFIQALKDLLAPINSLLNVIFAGESLDILKIEPDEAGHIDHNDYLIHLSGAYAYNYAIIPLLEALGAPNIKTFEEYQALAKSTDPVSPLVEMILDLVDEISAAPINWALANLPNIIAFISDPNALINVINALIAPLKPIVDAVLPLLVDDANPVTLPLVGTITSATTVDALLAELVGNLDVKAILNDLLGNVDLGTGALALGTADDLFQALLIGTKVKEDGKASADIAASLAWLVNHDPASDPITVDRAERTNIVADKAGLFSSLVTYLIGKVATNKSALLSLLGAAQGDLVDTILTNVGVNPQVILNILHKLRFGSAVEQNTDIYKDFDKYIAATETDPASGHIKLGAVEYVSPFTAEKADALVQGLLAGEHNANGASPLADKSELDLIVSWLIGFLNRQGILPFSDLKTLVEGLLGDQLFNAQLFESIVSVLQGVVANESVAGILSIADEHLTLDLTSFLKAEVDLTALNNATTYAQRKAAFKAALTELIRPIAPLLNVFLAGQDLAEIDIDPSSEFNPLITLSAAYGYNNGLIPIFEALGLGHIDGYVLPDYAAYQASAAGGDPVGPLVEVLLQLVEQIYTNPVDWLLSNLPTILAFVGDSHALANSLDALLAPVYGLVEVLEPLIAGIDVGGLIGLDNLVLTDLVASILPTMNAKDLVSLFLPDGIAIAGLTFTDAELTALVSELFDSLILGSIKEETSGAVKIVDGVPTSEHVKRKYIDADKGDLLTSLFTFIVSKVEDLDVLSLLNVELSDPIGTIVNNVYDNPQAVLNLLYHLKFGLGAPSGSLAEVYQGFVDLRTSGKVHPFVYQHPYWDAGMSGTLYGSNHLVAPNSYNDNDLAVVVDSILNYVTGQTAGQYVKAIIGPTIYGTDLFNKVIELIGGIAGDPNLASILDIADEVLDNIDLQDVLDLSEVPALDGTRETFELALEKALNPLKPLLDVFLAGKPFKVIKLDGTDDKDTLITISAFAGYEYGIKPLLETLGASAPSYAAIQSASNPLKPIIKAVLDLLESIYKNPVDWALTNLPNIIAFIESGTLKYAVEQIAQPIYTLAEVIAPLAKGVEINGEELDIIALANSVLSSIDLKKLASDFLAPGISIGDINIVTAWLNAGGEEETLLQGLIDALLVGTLVENADGSFKVIADKPGLVTSIVDYLIGTAVVKNQAALEGLLGGSITEPIKGILDNLTANPQLILRVISNILYGNGFTQSYIVYKTENLGMSGAGDVTYREEWWTRNHAKYVWDRAPDFVNKLWELLFGKPLGNLDLGGLGTTAGSFLEDIIGSALFTQENLNALVALVNDNVPDLNTIEIGGKSLVTLLKEGVVINGQSLDLDAMFAKFRGYTPAAYPVTTRESFIAHLVTLAAPLVPVLDILLAGSNIEIIKRTEPGPSDEKYVVNIYGAEGYKYVLIPLLEAFTAPLGKNEWVYTPDQFKDFNGEQKLNAIFEPLLKTLELVLADPINNGIKIIPNLIYTLEGQANALIQKLLDPAYNLVGSFGDVYAFDLASLIPTIDIPNILDGILQGTGLGLSYDALKTLLVGKLLTYTSRNGDTAAKYVSLVDPAQPDYDYMPDILTAVLRFVVITFVANKANQKVVIDWLISNGLSGAKLKIIQTTVDDIFVFIREGHISDIHGRFVLGADIFLNFAFILFYGLDKVVCKIYDTWKSVNAEISKSYQNLLNSHKYDQSFAKNAEAFTNRYFKPIVDVNSDNGTVTVAPNGFIAFWLNIIAWFKKIFSFLF